MNEAIVNRIIGIRSWLEQKFVLIKVNDKEKIKNMSPKRFVNIVSNPALIALLLL